MNKMMDLDFPDWSTNKKLEYSLLAMIPLGLGEVLGGFMLGFVIDKWNQKAGVAFCILTAAVALALVLGWIGLWKFYPLAFIVTFFWGIHDSAFVNFLNCVLGFEFDSKIIPFSIFKFLQSLFTFVFLVADSYLNTDKDYLIFFIISAVYAFLSMTVMFFFKYKDTSHQDTVT